LALPGGKLTGNTVYLLVYLTTRGNRARHQDVDHNRDDNRDAADEGDRVHVLYYHGVPDDCGSVLL